MTGELVRRSTTHGLLFLMFLSFIASFLIAGVFATLNPTTVVITGGIHFHHFWYGLHDSRRGRARDSPQRP